VDCTVDSAICQMDSAHLAPRQMREALDDRDGRLMKNGSIQ
jgi:hypothetical protein